VKVLIGVLHFIHQLQIPYCSVRVGRVVSFPAYVTVCLYSYKLAGDEPGDTDATAVDPHFDVEGKMSTADEEIRISSSHKTVVLCRPSVKARGHTGYLTFARKFV
jgi:hypothetical protein